MHRFSVASKEFALQEHGADHAPRVRFAAWEEGLEPLCRGIETAWAYGPERFLDSVLARTGQSFEGEVAFAFHEQYPHELQEGVTFDWLGQTCTIDESVLDAVAIAYGEASVSLARREGAHAEALHGVLARLAALRARLAEA